MITIIMMIIIIIAIMITMLKNTTTNSSNDNNNKIINNPFPPGDFSIGSTTVTLLVFFIYLMLTFPNFTSQLMSI